MNILALNTSFSESYVAVKNNTKTVLKNMNSSLKQSENILGLIDDALGEANIKVNELDAISTVIGPGSFTGIRIGASLAKGICTAHKHIKRIEINSLDLLAYTFSKTNPEKDFWVVLNALSGNLFTCKYNKESNSIIEHKLITDKELNLQKGEIVVGLEEESLDLCNAYASFNSSDLLEYTIKLIENNQFSNDFIPLYLRKSQAEENANG